jgi:hypothetical protein
MSAVDRDTGLGTTYERIAVARMLEDLAERYRIGSVLEGPTDGITGIRGLNSIPLAQAGASVDLVLGDASEVALAARVWDALGLSRLLRIRSARGFHLDAEPRSFDLVWNFNSIPQVKNPERLLSEMCEASRSLVLVFTSNTWNYGFPLHRLHHRAAREEWTHGDIAMMDDRRIARTLAARGFELVERLYVDTPWWPDIDSPIEEVAATFLPFLKGLKQGSKRLERYTWTASNLPYFVPDRRRALEAELDGHFVIERMRRFPLKALFAHHRGVLARRGEKL